MAPAIMFNVSLALPISHMASLKNLPVHGGHIFTLHAGTAEPYQVSPPEAVVYLFVNYLLLPRRREVHMTAPLLSPASLSIS
ncbi:hypothetical protein [uncultured Microbulbifer sp.]|uniref:hypothetical protein n=1 Tax=uncultured Microbulbifer sp. TaxID=348147 RepID=UPI002634C211|nr:hypothetical protein [uncultured Microbulbifer sp.]